MNISSCNTIRIYGIRDRLKKDKIMNALKKTALGLTLIATTAFAAVAQSDQLAPNDNAKGKVVVNNDLPNYTSAVAGSSADIARHTRRSGSLGMVLFGPLGSEEKLETKANELFNAYKPHVDDMIVVFRIDPRFREFLVGVVHDGGARPGTYGVDDMIGAYEKVLKHYGIDVSKTTASIAGLDLDR